MRHELQGLASRDHSLKISTYLTVNAFILFGLLLLPSLAFGDVVALHSGNADPTTEGWTEDGDGSGVTVGPITNDMGTGLDAWFVDDDSIAAGSATFYTVTPNASQLTQAQAGWNLQVNIRLPDLNDAPPGGAPGARFSDGSTIWQMHFATEADGDPIVELITDGASTFASYTLDGSGGGYHLYELVYDPLTDTADLFVDGIEQISDYGGWSLAIGPQVAWGSFTSGDTGQGNFNLVSFSVVPEPGSVFLLMILSTTCCCYRKRSRK